MLGYPPTPLSLSRTGPHPPSCCTHAGTASHGTPTEPQSNGSRDKGGVVPPFRPGGVPTPPPALPQDPPPPAPHSLSMTWDHPPLLHGHWHGFPWSSRLDTHFRTYKKGRGVVPPLRPGGVPTPPPALLKDLPPLSPTRSA